MSLLNKAVLPEDVAPCNRVVHRLSTYPPQRHIEVLRLWLLSDGDPLCLERLRQSLRCQQDAGDVRILHMDDETATIELLNPSWAYLMSTPSPEAMS